MQLSHWLMFAMCCWLPVCQAQITLDGTLGPSGALAGPDYAITAALGQQRGNHLFHSFSAFNLTASESATFSGPPDITSIISRVTGGHMSHIAGALNSTIPNADLYLLNPAGILFSDNASLNLYGSFYASTADTLHFSDGSEFKARFPEHSTLTAAPIAAFGFLETTAGSIHLANTALQVPDESTLTLHAHRIQLDNSRITSTGHNPDQPNSIHLEANDIHIETSALISTTTLTAPGGDITIQAQHLTVQNDAGIVSFTETPQQAGDIRIQAETIVLNDVGEAWQTNIANMTAGAGDSGDILINAGQLTLQNGTELATQINTSTTGNTGKLEVIVTGDIALSGLDNTGESSELVMANFGAGNTGTLQIEADKLILQDGALVGGAIYANGNIGEVNINVQDLLSLAGRESDGDGGQVGIVILPTGTGQGSDINIRAGDIRVRDGGIIGAVTTGQGAAGNLNIEVRNTLRLEEFPPPDSASSQTQYEAISLSQLSLLTGGEGATGTIRVTARHLEVLNGAIIIAAAVDSSGDVGNIIIQVQETVYISGYYDTERNSVLMVASSGEGNAGNIEVTAAELHLVNGGSIAAEAQGSGDAGNIQLTIQGDIQLSGVDGEGEGSVIAVQAEGDGDAGTLTLEARNLLLTDGAIIGAASEGVGDAGSVDIVVADTVRLQGFDAVGASSIIGVSSLRDGNAGTVSLQAKQLHLTDGALILGDAAGNGRAGNIHILVDEADFSGKNLQALQGDFVSEYQTALTASSGIYAGTDGQGQGGTITLTAQRLQLSDTAMINSSTQGLGNGGEIFINAGHLYLNAASIIADSTAAGHAGNVQINVDSTLLMENSVIDTEALTADGGNIQVNSEGYLRLTDSQIRTSINALDGSDGNIALNNQFVLLERSQILAETTNGEAGTIDILTQGLFVFPPVDASEIRATSDLNIEIALERENVADFTLLPAEFLAAAELLFKPCSVTNDSSFTLADYPGIGVQPEDMQNNGISTLLFSQAD